MAKKDEKLQAYEELTTQMNASTVTLDAEKRQKLHEILHQKPEFAQLLEKFKALCSDNETRKAISEICPASEADDHFDFKAMLQSMGAYCKIDPDKDGYVFNWPGKQTAIQLANEPTENTLIPDKADSRDWDTTQNIYIEGDNLEVLKCLRNAYAGKVKIIYIDPPYNTGNDFIYNDKFHGEKVSSDDAGKHTKWLNMMYSRIMLAREVLSEDGVIFISIDDNEIANLKEICDKIFGVGNFVAQLVWEKKKKGAFLSNNYINMKEYIIVYTKNTCKFNGLIGEINDNLETYPCIKTTNARGVRTIHAGVPSKYKDKCYCIKAGTRISSGNMELIYLDDAVIDNGILINDVRIESNWIYNQESLDGFQETLYITQDNYIRRVVCDSRNKLLKDLLLRVGTDNKCNNKFVYNNNLNNGGWGTNEDANEELHELLGVQYVFDHSKPSVLIAKLLQAVMDKDCYVMDFFSGSATTAQAVMELNNADVGKRKYIMVNIQETITSQYDKTGKLKSESTNNRAISFLDSIHKPHNICEIGKARIRLAGDKIKADNTLTTKDLDIGFRVFRVGKSNIPKWWAVDDAQRQLNMFDNEEDKRTDEEKYRAIAYEFMLKHKCMLDARVDEYLTPDQMAQTEGKPLFVVDGALFICPVGGVNAAWAASVVALRRSRYAVTSNDAWFVAVNDTLDDSSDNRDSDKLLAVKTLVEAGLPAKHFLHI